MTSYHDRIQEVARAIEAERAKSYLKGSAKKKLVWDEEDLTYLEGASYKLRRARFFTHNLLKALDDFTDAYNYVALEVNKLIKQIEAENPGMRVTYNVQLSKFELTPATESKP